MIDKDVERQIAFIHAAYGLAAGIILGLFYKSDVVPFLSVLIWGIIVSYPAMLITKRKFKLSADEYNIKTWLAKGFFYFFSIWIVVWIFMYNLR